MGKQKAPAAPDYSAAAQATAQGNLDAAKYATNANRINQKTPYGSLTYQYNPVYDSQGKETGAGWTQTEDLTPQAQAALDQELALNQKYGEVANIGFDRTRNIFENPELNTSGLSDLKSINANNLPAYRNIDTSGLAAMPINAGTTAQQAILSRLNPQLSQNEEALRSRLANQGITLGSDAYNREMTQAGQQRNDLETQAALQGLSLDMSARQQGLGEQQTLAAFQNAMRNQNFGEQQAISSNAADIRQRQLQEQAYLQDRPLNLINALRSGNQVTSPQFQQFSQQATTQGPDMLAAQQAQYNAQLGAVNAANAGKAGLTKGLMGLGAAAAGLPTTGGGSLGGNYLKGLFGG
jgi:hypothetical protein